jgi:hypothetical protein
MNMLRAVSCLVLLTLLCGLSSIALGQAATFDANPNPVAAGQTVTFTGNPVIPATCLDQYEWTHHVGEIFFEWSGELKCIPPPSARTRHGFIQHG